MKVASLLFGFEGRLSRRMFWIAAATVNPAIAVIFYVPGLIAELGNRPASPLALILAVVGLAIQIWVDLAVMVKRLHDRDRSGWLLVVLVVPLIGPLWLVIELYLLRGTTGSNHFGLPPLDSRDVVPDKATGPKRYAGPTGFPWA